MATITCSGSEESSASFSLPLCCSCLLFSTCLSSPTGVVLWRLSVLLAVCCCCCCWCHCHYCPGSWCKPLNSFKPRFGGRVCKCVFVYVRRLHWKYLPMSNGSDCCLQSTSKPSLVLFLFFQCQWTFFDSLFCCIAKDCACQQSSTKCSCFYVTQCRSGSIFVLLYFALCLIISLTSTPLQPTSSLSIAHYSLCYQIVTLVNVLTKNLATCFTTIFWSTLRIQQNKIWFLLWNKNQIFHNFKFLFQSHLYN